MSKNEKKVFKISTPAINAASIIENTPKRVYFVSCPHCAAQQALKAELWGAGSTAGKVGVECEHCHKDIDEAYKMAMLEAGRWGTVALPAPQEEEEDEVCHYIHCFMSADRQGSEQDEVIEAWVRANATPEEIEKAKEAAAQEWLWNIIDFSWVDATAEEIEEAE